jgi:hypothetical protein
MTTQILAFLKQLLDNAEYANETGLLNVIKLFKHEDPDVTEGTAFTPGAFTTFQRLAHMRPDLCTPAVVQELSTLAGDEDQRVSAVARAALGELSSLRGHP